jgi:bacterioferritin-associated ferredoxin
MNPDDEVCLCFHVSLRKIRAYLQRENPPVASLISECLSAGTGCQWCVPFLRHLHAEHRRGNTPDLRVSPEQYATDRLVYHKDPQGKRTGESATIISPPSTDPPSLPPPTPPMQ